MTAASRSPRDLVKVPVYNFVELLRLVGDRHGTIRRGGEACFPASDLYHAITVSDDRIAALFAAFPPSGEGSWDIDYALREIPWPRVNVARFRIDEDRSNAFAAAGRTMDAHPDVDAVRRIRQAQELSTDAPLRSGVALADGEFRDAFRLGPFATVLHWITPFGDEEPATPRWLEATPEDGNVVLRWTPSRERFFYSYELRRLAADGAPGPLLSPTPLRAAMWIDTAPPAGTHRYAVRAVSASGIAGGTATSPPATIQAG